MSFTNTLEWLMVASISAKNAQKKMQENTVEKILKRSGRMTENAAKTKIVFKPKFKSQKRGEKRTGDGVGRTALLLGPSDVVNSFESLVSHVVTQPPWHTTMTMTSLSLFAGSANRVTRFTMLGTKPF